MYIFDILIARFAFWNAQVMLFSYLLTIKGDDLALIIFFVNLPVLRCLVFTRNYISSNNEKLVNFTIPRIPKGLVFLSRVFPINASPCFKSVSRNINTQKVFPLTSIVI